jgi:tetraprenyl-beta-curcumene synthase
VLAGRRGTLPLARSFAGAARDYWLEVFPCVNRELARWRELAQGIPDPRLRELALETQRGERGNLEGAAAFAVLAPRERRREVVRAAVCFQALYDYLDTLAEQPCPDPVETARSLHEALPAALDPNRAPRLTGAADDYLGALIAASRAAVTNLPSWDAVAGQAIAAAESMTVYQSLVHGDTAASRTRLEAWAEGLRPPASGLSWWETAAGAASSLCVFALLAAAARGGLDPDEASALQAAYFPWAGALHVLLDSLVDREADMRSGHRSLVAEYESSAHMACRLAAIAERARACAQQARQGERHVLILGAMASFYLSRPAAGTAWARPAREAVLSAIGPPAAPSMALLRARGAAERLASPGRTGTRAIAPSATRRARGAPGRRMNRSLDPVTRNSSI